MDFESSLTGVLTTERANLHAHTQSTPRERESRKGANILMSQGTPDMAAIPPEREAQSRPSLKPSGGAHPPASSLQNCEMVGFCYLRHLAGGTL